MSRCPPFRYTEEEQTRAVRKLKIVGLAASALLLIGVGYVVVKPTPSTDRTQHVEAQASSRP
jgi:hypothetical protein